MKTQLQMLSVATLFALATSSYAQTMCVYDPSGTQGDAYSFMKDYVVAAKQWGADITLKPYTDDEKANDAFKHGKCDGLSTIGSRMREFNSFTGSIDSIGTIPTAADAKTMIELMANPKLAPEMTNGDTEVVGVSAVGGAFPMVNDRTMNTMAKMVGKSFGALSFDPAQMLMPEKMGCNIVPVTVSTIGHAFNSGQAQIIALPALAFKALDIAKGMAARNGAIVRFQAAYVTNQIVIYPAKFPDGYGQKSRTWVVGNLDDQLKKVKRIESSIASKYWLDLSANDILGYSRLFRQVRLDLTRTGVYNKRMMEILKKVRCLHDPSEFDCKMHDD